MRGIKQSILLIVCLGNIFLPVAAAKRYKQERFETGHFIRLGVGAGMCELNYKLQGGTTAMQPSWSLQAEYIYFFDKWIGVGSGVHFTRYATRANLTDEMVWTGLTDYMGDTYDHHLQFSNWFEHQRSIQMEIPIAAHFKYKPEKIGFFSAIGLKLGIPLQNTYSHDKGTLTHSAYYPFYDVWFKNLPGRYETETLTTPQKGKVEAMTKVNCIGFLETGALFEISKRTDITVSLYAQYTFNNAQRTATGRRSDLGFATQENGYGNFMNSYNGLLGTDHVGQVHPWTFGLKVGASVTPRLTEKEKMRKAKRIARKWKKYLPKKDTVTVNLTDTILLQDTIYIEQTSPAFQTDTTGIPLTHEQQLLDTLLSESVIWIDSDTSALNVEPAYLIDSVANLLRQYPDLHIAINAYTCMSDSCADKQILAQKRANTIADSIRSKGVTETQIQLSICGTEEPFRYNSRQTTERKRCIEIIPLTDADISKTDLQQEDDILHQEEDTPSQSTDNNSKSKSITRFEDANKSEKDEVVH